MIDMSYISSYHHCVFSTKAMQLIKGGSSKWVHETFPEHRLFGWQENTAHSVSVFLNWIKSSNTSNTRKHITEK